MEIYRNPKTFFWSVMFLAVLISGAFVLDSLLNPTPGNLVINEIMAGNVSTLSDEDGDYPDWIEIHNESDHPINLSGWALTNDPNQPEKWPFPNMTLRADEYLIIFASGKDRREVGPAKVLHTNFRLSKLGEFLALYNRLDDRFGDKMPAGAAQFEDISYGRYGKNLQYGYLATATPGQANGKLLAEVEAVSPVSFAAEPPNNGSAPVELASIAPDNLLAWQSGSTQDIGSVKTIMQDIFLGDNFQGIFNQGEEKPAELASQLYITELMYNPLVGDEYEFLRLSNLGSQPVIVSGAYFDQGISFVFPASTPPLAPGGSIILAHNEAAFAEKYPGLAIGGVYQGQLSNDGERITLRTLTSSVLVSMAYDDENGWPLTADGRGDSLVLINRDNPDNSKNWRANSQVPGWSEAMLLKP